MYVKPGGHQPCSIDLLNSSYFPYFPSNLGLKVTLLMFNLPHCFFCMKFKLMSKGGEGNLRGSLQFCVHLCPSISRPTGDMRTGLPDGQTTPKDRLGAPQARKQECSRSPSSPLRTLRKGPRGTAGELRGEPHGNHY